MSKNNNFLHYGCKKMTFMQNWYRIKLVMKYDVKRRIFKILKNFKDNELIKVVTGIRRCGKSTLFDLFEGYLLDNGVDESI